MISDYWRDFVSTIEMPELSPRFAPCAPTVLRTKTGEFNQDFLLTRTVQIYSLNISATIGSLLQELNSGMTWFFC